MKTKNRKLNEGLTLLEMIVALGIFTMAMVASVGILLGVSRANARTTAMQAVIDNIRFSLELMTREMRTGTDFRKTNLLCFRQIGEGIEFIDRNVPTGQAGKRRYYYLADTIPSGAPDGLAETIVRVALNNENTISCSNTTQTVETRFTAPEDVLVESFDIKLNGALLGASDGQPRVTLSLKIKSNDPRYQNDTDMTLQTTVIQRLLED